MLIDLLLDTRSDFARMKSFFDNKLPYFDMIEIFDISSEIVLKCVNMCLPINKENPDTPISVEAHGCVWHHFVKNAAPGQIGYILYNNDSYLSQLLNSVDVHGSTAIKVASDENETLMRKSQYLLHRYKLSSETVAYQSPRGTSIV